jgi:SAM-dependent methyltransferase/predicted kinase
MACAYLLCGPSLAGKSTLADRIAERFGARIVSADEINARRGLPFGAEGLPESTWAETLEQHLAAMRAAGEAGASVVVDDTLCYRWLRDRFRREAQAVGLAPQLLLMRPSAEEILARHAALTRTRTRPVLSSARLTEHLSSFEWPTSDEQPIDLTAAAAQEAWLGHGPDTDPWLDAWLPRIRERTAANAIVLELGCGSGRDSVVLAAAGCRVIGVDRSASAIEAARVCVPSGEFHVQDVREPFPPRAIGASVVVASLSLHYFAWEVTVALVRRIHHALPPGGVLLCRVNSINDRHHGASGHMAIEDDYYLVNGVPKRFFSEAAVDRLFAAGWHLLYREERCIHRYEQPKWVWEVVAECLKEPAP